MIMIEAIILESRELLFAFTAAVSFASVLILVALILKRRRLRTAHQEEYEVNEFALNAEMDAEIRRLNEAA